MKRMTIVHPLALGYEGMAIIVLKCNPDKVRGVVAKTSNLYCYRLHLRGFCVTKVEGHNTDFWSTILLAAPLGS